MGIETDVSKVLISRVPYMAVVCEVLGSQSHVKKQRFMSVEIVHIRYGSINSMVTVT